MAVKLAMSTIHLTGSEVSRPKILLTIEGVGDVEAEFHRFSAPRTVDALLRVLPTGGRAAIYGEEVYFQVPVQSPPETPKAIVPVGAIGYWPMNSAVCIFFGPTKPYSPVNLIGRVTGSLELFRKVKVGTMISIRRV